MKAMTRLAIFAVLLGYSSAAYADVKVTVLGIRSVEGDDEFANNLTASLRTQAGQIEGWQVNEKSMSLAQVGLAYGCEDPDAACLKEIAAGLETDIIIYGAIRRTTAGESYNYAITLNIFHGKTGGIENTVVDVIRSSHADERGLAAASTKLLGMLVRAAPQETGGTIAVQVNVPEAEVRLDGRSVGKTANGALMVEGIAAGDYKLEIAAPGYVSDQKQIKVTEGEQTSVASSLTALEAGQEAAAEAGRADKSHASLKWLGWTLVGVGGASLVGAVVSWAMIGSINGDSTFKDYRRRIGSSPEGGSVTDVCKEADNGNAFADPGDADYAQAEKDVSDVKSMCSSAATFEVLQYVFLAVGLVSGGAGAYILITDSGGSDQKASLRGPTLSLRPQISPYAGSITARLEF